MGGFDRAHPHRLAPEDYRRSGQIVFVTVRTRGTTSLSVPATSQQLVEAMGRVGGTRGVQVMAYCIMSDHVPVVVSPPDGSGDVAGWVRFLKRDAARRLRQPGMWQRSYWDRSARLDDDVEGMMAYTLDNPVRAGLCESWSEWPYSWSQWHPQSRGLDPHGPQRHGGQAPDGHARKTAASTKNG